MGSVLLPNMRVAVHASWKPKPLLFVHRGTGPVGEQHVLSGTR